MKLTVAAALGTLVALGVGSVALQSAGERADQERSKGMHGAQSKSTDSRAQYSKSGFDVTPLTEDRIEQLAQDLTPEERAILLGKGTERAFCGTLLDNKQTGAYTCRLCGLPLFSSGDKFQSGTGWPSFFQPIDPVHIHAERDLSNGVVRTEIQCVRCRAHLGHVFDDGPPPTGLRYCLNSAALRFYAHGAPLPPESCPLKTETAYFAGGCFWGIEDRFAQVPGVIDAVSGYMGGKTPDPTYKEVCTGQTEHAETVRVTYDPARVTYGQLLDRFFTFHDPTQVNRQGPDVGPQYRSAVFPADEAQRKLARQHIKQLEQSDAFGGRDIATRVEAAGPFFEAEEYHQDYHAKHGGSCALPDG